MGWAELHLIPNEYNDEVRNIDEQILELLNVRKRLADSKRYVPSKEIIQQWSERFDMQIPRIYSLLNSFNEGVKPVIPNETGELRAVVPIMKKTIADGCELVLTHAMHHEHASIVFLEIEYKDSSESDLHIRPHLLLEIVGGPNYAVRLNGSQGGGTRSQTRFLVAPPLPETMDHLQFSLVPHQSPFVSHIQKEIVLDRQIDFE
jgi:hypothetical protein